MDRVLRRLVVPMLAIAALAACNRDAPEPPPDFSSSSKPPSAASSGAALETELLRVYSGHVAAVVAASTASDYEHPELAKYIGDPLLGSVKTNIRENQRRGAVRTGTIGSTPRVTKVDLNGKPAQAAVEDCFDTTNYRLVYPGLGNSQAPPANPARYPVAATLWRYDDGRWLVTEAKADRSRSC